MEFLNRMGLGALIWVIMFAWISIVMFVFKLESGWVYNILAWLGAIVAVWFVAGMAKIKDVMDGFIVGLIFIITGIVLDWLITTKFNAELFSSWELWVSYAFFLVIPIIRGSMAKK